MSIYVLSLNVSIQSIFVSKYVSYIYIGIYESKILIFEQRRYKMNMFQ